LALREYRDDILYPISFDEAGAKAQMRVFFDAAEMQAKGNPPEELRKSSRNVQDTLLQSPGTSRCFIHAVSNP